jgi:hypothetical protein
MKYHNTTWPEHSPAFINYLSDIDIFGEIGGYHRVKGFIPVGQDLGCALHYVHLQLTLQGHEVFECKVDPCHAFAFLC